MRVLHLLKHGIRENGSVNVAVDLACEQARAGHTVTFASGAGSYDDVLKDAGVRVLRLPEVDTRRGALAALLHLDRVLHDSPVDVVHAHMMSSAILGALVAHRRGRPLVTTVHNSFDRHSNLMRLGTLVVAVSRAERDKLVHRGFAKDRLRVVVNGVLGSTRETAEGIEPAPALIQPAVVSLSGLHPRKAVDDVIRAFATTSSRWHLNVVGWGPQRGELEALTTELGLDDRVHFHGPTQRAGEVLKQAQVFVTASLADPCPLAVMEARIAGCAIVGTDVDGIPEILDGGRAGQLVPPRAPDAFGRTLDALLETPGAIEDWRNRAITGSDYFSTARVAAEHDVVYRDAIMRSVGYRLRKIVRATRQGLSS